IVMLRRDQPLDERLVAYVNLESECETSVLRDFLKQRLPDYMVPSAFINLPSIPLTQNGKVDRAKLPAPAVAGREHTSEDETALTPLERRLTGFSSDSSESSTSSQSSTRRQSNNTPLTSNRNTRMQSQRGRKMKNLLQMVGLDQYRQRYRLRRSLL